MCVHKDAGILVQGPDVEPVGECKPTARILRVLQDDKFSGRVVGSPGITGPFLDLTFPVINVPEKVGITEMSERQVKGLRFDKGRGGVHFR